VIISWTAPGDQGSPITAYTVRLLNKTSNTYEVYTTHCDGASALIITNRACPPILMSVFISTLGYSAGDLVKARIVATNAIGTGIQSEPNTAGAVIQTVPLGPTGLSIISSSQTEATLTWNSIHSPPENGYSTVTDYKVYWDNGPSTPAFDELLTTTANASSTTITGLTAGTTYNFKISAVNVLGTGTQSSAITLLSAIVPAQMLPVVISTSSNNLVITWAAPDTRGSVITAFEVRVLNMNSNVFEANIGICDYTALATTTCSISMSSLIANLGYQTGSGLYAIARAQNSKGWGPYSDVNTVT
jgi:hypothetical protein